MKSKKIITILFLFVSLALAQREFVGYNWQLQSIHPARSSVINIDTPENYTLILGEDSQAAIQADCNGCGGSYTYQRGSIDIEVGICTRIFCGDESHDQKFTAALGAATTLQTGDASLTLFSEESDTLVFARAPDTKPLAALVDKEWQLNSIQTTITDPPGIVIDSPEDYTLNFGEDMSLSAQLDCNGCAGTYTADSVSLEIGPLGCTDMACGPESMDQLIAGYFTQVRSYTVTDTTLILYVMDFVGTQLHYKTPGRTSRQNFSAQLSHSPEFDTRFIRQGQSFQLPEGYRLFDVTGRNNRGQKASGGVWILQKDPQKVK